LKPLVILSTVPLALIGALLGLWTTGWALGFMPSLGIISLVGVVINNAIVLVDFVESKVREGAALDDAIARAGGERMQPILLTTLTTVGGLLPLALFGGPMWAGMSWAMIAGLSLSTGLTLLVVPTIYATLVRVFGMQVVRNAGA
jgi:multidrug efflux pump subunit AcrB